MAYDTERLPKNAHDDGHAERLNELIRKQTTRQSSKVKRAPEPGSPIASDINPIYADAAEPSVVTLASGHQEALPTLDEAVRYVTGLQQNEKAGARIRTAGGAVYGVFEIDRLHHRTPEQNAKLVADAARYEALAREHGVDLSEEGFNDAFRKFARAKAT